MGEHTKGPWYVELHADGDRGEVISIQNMERFDPEEYEGDPTICGIWSTDPVDYANAHLIAAAPELLEALERAVQSMLDSGYNPLSAVIFSSLSAIAKAKGEKNE